MRGGAIEGFNSEKTKLFMEPFLGWRGWNWNPQIRKLCSLNGEPWEPGEELHARCTVHGSGHKAPDPQCNCGIFSMKHPALLSGHVHSRNKHTVIGTIKVWGDVIVGSKGYRGEYAMIDALYVPCSDAELTNLTMMKFMYDIDGDKNPTYLRSLMAEELEKIYGVTVFKHDPEKELALPDDWETELPF
jgi:hypothetical protein